MKNITLNPNSKIAKTAKFTFNYLHLIIIIAVLLLFNVESAQAQSAARSAAQTQVPVDSSVSEVPGNPNINVVAYNVISKNKGISVNSSKLMISIAVYDLSGRILFSANGLYQRDYKTPTLDSHRQVVVVKALFENNASASRNIVLN